MEEREVVKIASKNPAHPKGYYIQFKDKMKPTDKIFQEPAPAEEKPAAKKEK